MQTLFNDGWKFSKITIINKDDIDGKPVLFSPCDFYDKKPEYFSDVAIPHDWLIYDTNNLYENSVGFYQKEFNFFPKKKEEYYLRFEGVYQNWAVYVNKKPAFEWKYGYSTVEFCITPFLQEGNNLIELIAVYQSPNSRWYSGAGIFRDIYFISKNESRIAVDGVYFSANKISQNNLISIDWQINIETEIESKNQNNSYYVKHSLFLDNECIEIENQSESFEKKTGIKHVFRGIIKNPELWDIENPFLYRLKTELFLYDGTLLDSVEQNVGFRTIEFTPDRGFFLNGRHVLLHGVCEHHDFGLLGAEFNLTAQNRKFSKLRKMGVNAIRCSHNPPTPALLDLADKEGFLIIDECFDIWEMPKTKYDYGNYFKEYSERDCALWVRRDRNHPCIIMWSIGNEIFDTNFESGIRITKELKAIVRKNDPYKNAFVTSASNHMGNETPKKCAEELDVVGYNYAERFYDDHHKVHPLWCIYGSETGSHLQSRGVYHFPYNARPLTHPDNQCSSLGNTSVSWGARNAEFTTSQDYLKQYTAGQFLWTGFDYIGEPTPYTTKNSYFGQIDTAGFEKDSFFIYKAAWVSAEKEPFVHIFPYWDWNEGQKIDVRCCTNGYSAELFVNGKSMGVKTPENRNCDRLISATWEGVLYQAGSITIVAFDKNGKEIASETKKSFSDAKSIEAVVETASSDGLFFIDVSAVDKNGTPVENACDLIKITVSGAAKLIGADNGDSTDYDQYRSKDGVSIERRLFNNRLLVMVKAKNPDCDFEITASSSNLGMNKLFFKENKLIKTIKLKSAGQTNDFIPIRKIELVCTEKLVFSNEKRLHAIKAIVHPENAASEKLIWSARLARGITTDRIKINSAKIPGGEEAVIEALSDGDFTIVCSAYNKTRIPKVISEIECKCEGLGSTTLNPYQFVSASTCSKSAFPVELSFGNGVRVSREKSWFMFENVDFGNDGSDTFEISLYSPEDTVSFSVWNLLEGKNIGDFTYSAKTKWEIYQKNTFHLDKHLFGVQTISFEFNSSLSFEGFVFKKGVKAFSKLYAVEAISITGDSFVKTDNAIEKIGNNVTLDFDNMDFGSRNPEKLIICGHAAVDNNIQLVINSEKEDIRCTFNFGKTNDYEEKEFLLQDFSGLTTVSFIFLPGSQFDFKWFRFE